MAGEDSSQSSQRKKGQSDALGASATGSDILIVVLVHDIFVSPDGG
jgi:hypothetical protein